MGHRSGNDDVFRRSISPLEWWFLGHPPEMTPTFGLVIEGEGEIDPGRLTEAIAVASEACPGARLVRHEQEWVDGGTPPPLQVVEGSEDEDPLRIPQLQDCLPGPGTAFCQVVLVRRAGGRSAVAFRANHAVMDAHGLFTWARDVFRALRGEPVVGAPDPIADRDVYEQFPDRTDSPTPQTDRLSILGACEPTFQPRVVSARRAIQGRYPGVTARLAALLAEVVAEQEGASEAAFYVPVDLRHYRPEVRSTANLSLGMPVRVSPGEDWKDVHARLLQAVKDGAPVDNVVPDKALTAPLNAIESILLESNRQTREKERFSVDLVLSHAGRVELQDLCAPGFTPYTAFITERPLPAEAPVLNVLELDWHTELTISWWDGNVTQARLDGLLDRVVAGLETPATTPPHDDELPAGHEPADVVSRFLRQVEQTPDAPALDGGPDGVLTYRQLDRRTAAVAGALLERGAGPETVVGVLGDRSVASTIAVWGVLRAGAAYLPIDARNPDARIAGLLADSQASICLVQRPYDLRDCLPEGCVQIVVDDLGEHSDADLPVPAPEIRDDQLAFIIYTSGSTGRPKGVEIPHGAMRAWTDWAIRDLGFDADTRLPMLASLGFDVAACALYLPLLAGGTAVLRPAEISHSMLRELLLESGANTLMMTPSHLSLINSLGLRPKGFRAIVMMGEPLSTAVAREGQRVFGPDCAVIDSYGPTETTVIMTLHPFDADTDAADTALVPLGLPTTGTSVFILDDHGRFVADGETGEVWIGGPQLARGYRGQPELTRRSFVRMADGTRVYRSGDLARWIPGGPLEFVSRVDDQVKILGHRVEPAETAYVLRGHPAVAEAVVLPRPSGEHKALAAYVVPAAGAEVTADELGDYLSALLPAYLVPAATVFVDAIPHTMNGKVDARRLPDPFTRVLTPATSAVVRDPLTTAVAEIWFEILGIGPDKFDEDTDFQQLGGNSLNLLTMLATVADRVVGESARAEFDAALSTLVRMPTLRRVSDAVNAARSDAVNAAPTA